MIWLIKKFIYRLWNYIIWVVVRILPFPVPKLIQGEGSVVQLASHIKQVGNKKLLLVTDKPLMNIGLPNSLLAALDAQSIECVIFDGVQPNPTIENVEAGVSLYKENGCDGLIAFGGGSPIDCAKIIGARISNSFLSVRWMAGLFRVRFSLPDFYCVSTTAGTGSETTIGAVIKDAQAQTKFLITDINLVPKVAVLDPELTLGLPATITAATGMDALTHAIEAYIGIVGAQFSNQQAEDATRLVFENLKTVVEDGNNIAARNNMALASFYAGTAITRAYIGYVHAIAHNLGALYDVPHGLANAIILPYILEFCRDVVEDKLARLCVVAGLGQAGESSEVLASRFIEAIKELNRDLAIPTVIKELQEKDIPLIVTRALKEAHPEYPIPKFMSNKQCERILRKLLVGSLHSKKPESSTQYGMSQQFP